MATIFKQNGKWYVNFVFRGKRHKRMVGRSEKKAMEALRKVEADIINDRFDIPVRRKMKFRELAEYWLENHSKVHNAPSQYAKNAERMRNHLVPNFGNCDIAHITARMVDEYKKNRSGRIKPATINRTLAILRKMLNDAVRWGFVGSSPMRMIQQLPEKQQGFDFYAEDEVILFLQNCSPDFYPIASCAVYTGMRIGEIVALRWKDVDLERRVIRVERSGKGTTKSGKIRYVPVNSRLLAVLHACRERANGEFVFPDGKGRMRSIEFRNEMRNAAERAGLRRIRMHDLRHTFASNYVLKGGNLVSLQKILGHSTINMTLRYAHMAPDFMAKEIELLDFNAGPSLIRPQKEAVN
jgi:integrase